MSTREVKTYCRICISACGVVAEVDGDQVLSLRGDRDHPLTGGYTCAKGRALPAFHHSPDRLLAPRVRHDGHWVTTPWDAALDDLAAKLKAIIDESGPQSVGVFMGGGAYMDGLLYLVGRGASASLRTPQVYSDMTIDSIPKNFVAELVAGSALALTQPDFQRCRLTIFVGTNPSVSHGHSSIYASPTKLLRELTQRGEVWVLDPRRSETAYKATRHLAPRPGSDHAVLAYLVREILRDGADRDYIARHTQDVDRLADAVAPFDLAEATRLSGLQASDLTDLLAAVRRAGRLVVDDGTGMTMARSGAVVHWLSLALMAVTGSLDREGGVWFNPGLLTQARSRNIPSAPPEGFVQPGPQSRPELLSRCGEYPCAAMADEIEAGHLRALINLSGNLVACMPQTERTAAALSKLDVFATLEVRKTATTELSTHVLPVKGQLERIDAPFALDLIYPAIAASYTEPVVAPVGDVRSGWWVLAQIGKRLGYNFARGIDPDTASDEDFMAAATAGSGVSLADFKEQRYVQAEPPTFGWFLERVAQFGGWRLAPQALVDQLASLSVPTDGLVMISRRQAGSFNSRVDAADRTAIVMNPEDVAEAGLAEGAPAIVRSPHGQLAGTVHIDATLRRGVMNVPHGFTGMNANQLTSLHDIDPLTGMPIFSGLPVSVVPA